MDKSIAEILKKFRITQLLWIVFIITASLTFLNAGILETIGVFEFKNKYHLWIGISLLICSAGLIVIYIEKFYNYIYHKTHSIKKQIITAINELNSDESSTLIAFFYNSNEQCFIMESLIPVNNGVAAILRTKKIIILASKQIVFDENYGNCAVHVLQPDALKYLNESIDSGEIEINKTGYYWFS